MFKFMDIHFHELVDAFVGFGAESTAKFVMARRSTYVSNVIQLLFDFSVLYYQNNIQRVTKTKITPNVDGKNVKTWTFYGMQVRIKL